MLTDIHTHTTFSPDGKSEMEDMILTAIDKGIQYYGIAEHLDYDYAVNRILIDEHDLPLLKGHEYFAKGRELQQKYADKIKILLGVEVGFTTAQKAQDMVKLFIERFRPDFVVNSVHTVGTDDLWFLPFYANKTKQEAYRIYLRAIKQSVNADYGYDVIAHLGYPSRKAPYEDKPLTYEEFADDIDEILTTMIAKGKILECNSSTYGLDSVCLPDRSILQRYYDLGGRKLSFASDAHHVDRIACNRDKVVALLKEIGFTYLTIPDEWETKVEL